ncbi:MAG: OmpA family protein [Bacteroidota bacterium]
MQRITNFSYLLGLALLFCFPPLQAQDDNNNAFAFRYVAPNYVWPVSSFETLRNADFGAGLELEYYHHLSKLFDLSFPVRFNSSWLPQDEVNFRNRRRAFHLGADALLNLNLHRGRFFNPFLFGGAGVDWRELDELSLEIPLGIGLNFSLGRRTWLSLTSGYRFNSLENRQNFRYGLGLKINLGDPGPDPKDLDGDGIKNEDDDCPNTPGLEAFSGCPDRDGDGVRDGDDSCPDTPGLVNMKGCPDADGDGVTDSKDDCPTVAGLPTLNGCPDSDGDGVADPDDICETEAGPASNDGCPIIDSDGDGIVDDQDRCPDEAGAASANGCPDADGDGVADADDFCRNQVGTATNRGCPDTDNDSVIDIEDPCPNEPGPVSNQGCPELAEEDRVVILEEVKNIEFESGSDRLRNSSYPVLDKVVDILERYPGYQANIDGHTDSIGNADANQNLSERRARACYNYLISKGVLATRLNYRGFGETYPIADNRYAPGREQNRRVEFNLYIE